MRVQAAADATVGREASLQGPVVAMIHVKRGPSKGQAFSCAVVIGMRPFGIHAWRRGRRDGEVGVAGGEGAP